MIGRSRAQSAKSAAVTIMPMPPTMLTLKPSARSSWLSLVKKPVISEDDAVDTR